VLNNIGPGCRQVLPRLANQGAASDARQQPLLQRHGGAPVGAGRRWPIRRFAAYQRAAGETRSRYAEPQLVGPADAHLQPCSPAIDAGVRQQEVTVDLEGIARPHGRRPDVGAYELKVTTR